MKSLFVLLVLTTSLFSSAPRVVLISGSTREGSFNKKLITRATQIAKSQGASVQTIDLKKDPIPHYDGDHEIEKGMPQNAVRLYNAMVESQVIIISTPEYNGSISGVLKDALDWASRAPEGGPSRNAYKEKTFVLMSASPSPYGGKRGVEHLKVIVENVGGTCSQTFSLANAHEAFDARGNLKDPQLSEKLKNLIETSLR